jgi:diacylglycerol kinase (ATP)
MNSDRFSLRSRIESLRYAFNGLWSLLKNEHNSRIHLLAAIGAISMGFILKIDSLEWCVIILLIGIVFLAELLNSSLETLADIVKPGCDEGVRRVKDYSAAAVLVSAIMSVIAGGLIFIPKIFR